VIDTGKRGRLLYVTYRALTDLYSAIYTATYHQQQVIKCSRLGQVLILAVVDCAPRIAPSSN